MTMATEPTLAELRAELKRRVGERAGAMLVTWGDMHHAIFKDGTTVTGEPNQAVGALHAVDTRAWLAEVLAESTDQELLEAAEAARVRLLELQKAGKLNPN